MTLMNGQARLELHPSTNNPLNSIAKAITLRNPVIQVQIQGDQPTVMAKCKDAQAGTLVSLYLGSIELRRRQGRVSPGLPGRGE